jgi:hypothetical protein
MVALQLSAWSLASAAVINIAPTDAPAVAYTKIEAAQPGDEVVIAPGKYHFLVNLTAQGTAALPIVIRAQDPANRPVWDFTGKLLDTALGSYTSPDRNRAAWQILGGKGYHISGIVFSNCRNTPKNAAGIRYLSGATNIYVKDCLFTANDNGITGGSQDSEATFEFCEFDHNGNPLAKKAPTHNVYIFGGTFAMRYCYVHDSVQGQNFHIRAHHATLEYNWFARAASYEGDFMPDDDFYGNGPFAQTMLLRGNILVQSLHPRNVNKAITVFNDREAPYKLPHLTLSLQLINNTYVGNGVSGQGGDANLVQLSNGDGTQMNMSVFNNIIFGTTTPVSAANSSYATSSSGNNWLPAGVNPGLLTGSIFSTSPGFQNAANADFTLAAGSAARNAANPSLTGLPTAEYFQNEFNVRQYRARATANDLGAFESTTSGIAVGPYGTVAPIANVGGVNVPVGQFNGLFYDTNNVAQQSSGFVSLSIAPNLAYSGRLLLDGDTIPFTGGSFPIVSQTISRAAWGKSTLTLNLNFAAPVSSQQLTGSVNSTNWTADAVADRAVWNQFTSAGLYANNYTMVLSGSTNAATAPGGNGYGFIKLNLAGVITFTGVAGDGVTLNQTVPLSKDGYWPFYVPLYSAPVKVTNGAVITTISQYQGSALGWLNFDGNHQAPTGSVSWIKKANVGSLYSGGFISQPAVLSSRYVAPTVGSRALDLSSGDVTIRGGNLLVPFTNTFTFSTKNLFALHAPSPTANYFPSQLLPAN